MDERCAYVYRHEVLLCGGCLANPLTYYIILTDIHFTVTHFGSIYFGNYYQSFE